MKAEIPTSYLGDGSVAKCLHKYYKTNTCHLFLKELASRNAVTATNMQKSTNIQHLKKCVLYISRNAMISFFFFSIVQFLLYIFSSRKQNCDYILNKEETP